MFIKCRGIVTLIVLICIKSSVVKEIPPSMETINQISQFLRLTESEHQILTDAWQLTLLGPQKYYRRKSVENFC